MAKIFYTVAVAMPDFPVYYISEIGRVLKHDEKYSSPADACEEFECWHPGAVYLDAKDWDKHQAQLEHEKKLLASWTGGK